MVFYVFTDTGEGEQQSSGMEFIMTVLAIFLPIAVIWIGAVAARSARIMKAESTRLQTAIDGMRQTYIAQVQHGGTGNGPTMEQKLDQIAAAQKERLVVELIERGLRRCPANFHVFSRD